MSLEKIKTSQLADVIKDRIDDLRVLNRLPEPALRRMISFKKLLRTINEADIDLSGYLKQESQIIIHLPKDYSEIYLKNSELQKAEYFSQVDSLDIAEGQKVTLFNYDFWSMVGGIKDTYLLGSKQYPIGKRVESSRYRLVPYDEYSDVTHKFKDHIYEGVLPAFYDSRRFRIVLDEPVTSDTFFHFTGYLLAEKIDFTAIAEDEWDDYSVTSPEYAEEALVLGVMKRLMPVGSELRDLYAMEYEREKNSAAARMPTDTSTFTLDSNIGP